MSNKPRQRSSARPAPRPAGARGKAATRSTNTTLLIIAGVVALVAVAGIVIALVVGGGDDGDDGDSEALATTVADCADVEPGEPIEPGTPGAFRDEGAFKPVAITGTPLAEYGADPDEGLCQQVPVLAGYDYDGEPVTIDPARDGPTLVVFLAHWCPHCNAEIPVLNEWRDSGNVPDELNVVGVSTAARAGEPNYPPGRWLEDMDWTWPVLADGDTSTDEGTEGDDGEVVYQTALRSYGTTGFPTLAFVDGDGLLRWRISGELPASALQALVDAALADTSSDTSSTSDTSNS